MHFSIKQLRIFVFIKDLLSIIVKICASIFSILLITVFSLVILLSVKPRNIRELNIRILSYIEKNTEILSNFKFNIDTATVYLNRKSGLEYKINDIEANINNHEFKLSSLTIGLDFYDLFFGRINIESISLSGSKLEFNIRDNINVSANDSDFDVKKIIKKINDEISELAESNHMVPREFIFNDFDIRLINGDTVNDLDVVYSRFKFDFKDRNALVDADIGFKMNNDAAVIKFKTSCERRDRNRRCEVFFSNFNPYGFKTVFKSKTIIGNYAQNINAVTNGRLTVVLNEDLDMDNGRFELNSPSGYFDLREFFDERVDFKNLKLIGGFNDRLKNFFINSLKTEFGEANFEMGLSLKTKDEYTDLDLSFDVENLPLKDLKKLWPNFLGQEEEIRPWVIEHITDGYSKKAWAKMNMKYFPEGSRNESGLQKIDSEVSIDDAYLNYDDNFPPVSNINGLAKFTEKDMIITIKSGNILNTNATNVVLKTNFEDKIPELSIKGTVKGPFSDLLVHADYLDRESIEKNSGIILEDYYTNSSVNISFPYEDLTFKKAYINISADVLNKKDNIFKNETQIPVSFTKKANSDSFFGNLNLTNVDIQFLPINIDKPSKQDLSLYYKCTLDKDIVYIDEISSKSEGIDLNASGFFDLESGEQLLNIKNISYNDSLFDVMFNFKYLNKKRTSVYVVLSGEKIIFDNLINKINSFSRTNNTNNFVDHLNISASLKYLVLDNDKRLFFPTMNATFTNGQLVNGTFSAKLANDKSLTIDTNVNKKHETINIYSDDYGNLMNTLGITDKLIGGGGSVIIENYDIKNAKSVHGNIKIDKEFIIILDNETNKDVLEDIEKDKNFKDLRKSLRKKSNVAFNRLRGDFSYSSNILTLKDIIANSNFINLEILATGFVNMKTEEVKINGLIVPAGFFNSLFGMSKIPIIGDVIFGEKNAGIFASKFSVTKEDADSKLDFDINKFSMMFPGFLRNIFN